MRVSAVAERAGFLTVSVVATGFMPMARAIAQTQGLGHLAIAEYPGVPMTDSKEELSNKVEKTLVPNIIEGLAKPVQRAEKPVEPGPRDIVFKGSLDQVQEFFTQNLWTDGLPVIPPTIERVESFLRFTERSPEERVGVLLPENREATVWNVAVNGVMAGCRPEYMPLLTAAVEAIADPEFRIQDGGSTPGWEPLVILNGPIIKELDFNYGQGVMRVGRQANTSVGRFLRLYMRNVPGLRIPPGTTDKGTIGYTFNVALAENEDAVAELGWEPFSVERGFQPGENVVTVQSVVSISPPIYTAGDRAPSHLETLAEAMGQASAYRTFAAMRKGVWYPLLVISPSIATVLAKDGYTKSDVKRYLYEKVKITARAVQKYGWEGGGYTVDFAALVEQGVLPKVYYQSTDPDRLVPMFLRPDWIGIVVAGDPARNQSKGYVNNQKQGVPVSRKIELPAKWKQLLKEVRK